MRTGVGTSTSGGSSSTATQLLDKDPANQVQPTYAASSSQVGDNGSGRDDTRPPQSPYNTCVSRQYRSRLDELLVGSPKQGAF